MARLASSSVATASGKGMSCCCSAYSSSPAAPAKVSATPRPAQKSAIQRSTPSMISYVVTIIAAAYACQPPCASRLDRAL